MSTCVGMSTRGGALNDVVGTRVITLTSDGDKLRGVIDSGEGTCQLGFGFMLVPKTDTT